MITLAILPRSAAAVFAVALGLVGGVQAGEPMRDDLIKASYLYKFTPFVGWPRQAFEGPLSSFNLCIAGRERFSAAVDEVVRGRRVGDHPIAVIRLEAVSSSAGCHLLFLGRSAVQTPREMLEAVAGQPVLTVADQGLSAGDAMIQFVTVAGQTRFEIRPEMAETSGLIFSSKLLSLSARRGGDR